MTESEFQAEVVRLANNAGLLIHHCNDARRCSGPNGLPDLIMVGRRTVLWAELKLDHTELRSSQVRWKYRLIGAGQQYALWRPRDLPRIPHVLRDL